jgi:hypothetical protein
MKRQLRQARYRKKPEVRLRRREEDRTYYRTHQEAIKAKTFGLAANGLDVRRQEELIRRYRVIGPGDPIPSQADEVTRTSYGSEVNSSTMWVLEARYPPPDGPWGCVTAAPDLTTLLSLGGKGENRALKGFLRGEMLRRFPERYCHVDDLPTESEILRREVGPPDIRLTEKRIAYAQAAQLTPDFLCPVEHCRYFGPMLPTGKGPYRAEAFLEETSRKRLGAEPYDLLPGAYCPQCRALVIFPAGADIGRPPGTGDENGFRCGCGFNGKLSPDPATLESYCPACGLVLLQYRDDRPPPPHPDE